MSTVLANSLRMSVRERPKTLSLPEVAKQMDEVWPDWHRRVDPHTLDIADTRKCVMGQIAGTYSAGIDKLGDRVVYHTPGIFSSNAYREAWIDEITDRLAKDAPPAPKPKRRVLTAVSTLVASLLP